MVSGRLLLMSLLFVDRWHANYVTHRHNGEEEHAGKLNFFGGNVSANLYHLIHIIGKPVYWRSLLSPFTHG